MVSDPAGERALAGLERVEDDTGEEGTGAATTELVGVPADLPRRAEAPPRGVLVITDREGNPSSERKRVARWNPATPICTTKTNAHSRIFSSLFSDNSTVTKDRTGIVRAARRRTYGSMAPRRRRTLMPKGQTNRSDTWALSAKGARHRTHAPIGLLALSFCECLRSVKQSRRLNLSALSLMHLGVCHYSCGAST